MPAPPLLRHSLALTEHLTDRHVTFHFGFEMFFFIVSVFIESVCMHSLATLSIRLLFKQISLSQGSVAKDIFWWGEGGKGNTQISVFLSVLYKSSSPMFIVLIFLLSFKLPLDSLVFFNSILLN